MAIAKYKYIFKCINVCVFKNTIYQSLYRLIKSHLSTNICLNGATIPFYLICNFDNLNFITGALTTKPYNLASTFFW